MNKKCIGNEKEVKGFEWKGLAIQAPNFIYYTFINHFLVICGAPPCPIDLGLETNGFWIKVFVKENPFFCDILVSFSGSRMWIRSE